MTSVVSVPIRRAAIALRGVVLFIVVTAALAGRAAVASEARRPLSVSTSDGPQGAPQLAVTIDDIPAHGPLPPGVDRQAVADAIIGALRAHGVPAQGFYNATFGIDDPQSLGVVAAWRVAGFPLGNHGYSHLDLDQVGATAFVADAIRDEGPLAAIMGDADWRWFRYPFLHEGKTAAQRATVRSALQGRGYRIAAVTMSFGDFGWNEPYARCARRNDQNAVASLERSYLDAARREAGNAHTMSEQLYGRDIPYVLLLHFGAFDARMLPRLLDLYEAMGFRFVPLSVAERDPVYAAAIDLAGSGPSPTLETASAARGHVVPKPPPLPASTVCR